MPVQDPPLEYSSLEQLIDLPQDEAVRRHLDSLNYRWLRRYAITFSALAFIVVLIRVAESDYLGLILPAFNLVLVRSLFVATERTSFQAHFRPILISYLLLQVALGAFYPNQLDKGLELAGFIGPILFLAYRLTTTQHLLLYVPVWAGTIAPHFLDAAAFPWLWAITQTAVTVICLYFSVSATRLERRRFLRTFRIEGSRNRDRQRMRQELDLARQIQLGMLPRSDPQVDGLDISAISLPATEVGGDYYEYFSADSRLTIVVGDAAGHGMASGLLLSGLRSCLYLLHEDEPPPPLETVNRLDRMVKQTTDHRMFITLLYTVFDCRRGELTLSSAGHPPILHYRRATNTVGEIRQCALPLGTHLETRYEEVVVGFSSGDVFVLYTDGLNEVLNQNGDDYGDRRLFKQLTKVAKQKSAREIREAMLNSAWNFKGDAEQLDDVTMVVVKVG